MTQSQQAYGIIGLGRIGGSLARQGLEEGARIIGFTRDGAPEELKQAGLIEIRRLEDFLERLEPPRIVFLYVPAGPTIDTLLDQLSGILQRNDIIVDGGNSYWGDSIRRHARLKEKGLSFVDLGTSGGVEGAQRGACFMVGGESEAVARVEPILKPLAVEGGYVHAGGPGAGHFTKLVHNGIEFGMLQAIGEGIDLLARFREPLDVPKVLSAWRHGSVIRSWLIELMEEQYREHGSLTKIPGFVEDTGEVNWLVADALKMEVAIPVIAQSVMQLFASRDDQKNWARAIAMMRHAFGGHPFGPDKEVEHERKQGRVGEIWTEGR